MIGYILLIISVVEVILGFYLIFRYVKSPATIYYGLFALSVALYVGANGYGFSPFSENDIWLEIIAWIGGTFTAPFILGFSYSFPYPRKSNKEILSLVLSPLVFFFVVILFSNTFVDHNSVISFDEGFQRPVGELHWFVLSVFFFYWVWSFIELVKSRKKSDGFNKNFLLILIIGLVFSLLVSVFTNIIHPLVDVSKLGYMGPLASSIWLFITGYLILRK